VIAPPVEEMALVVREKVKPVITAEKDEGERAKDILEKIKQKKLSTVIKKLPEEVTEKLPTKAPIIQQEKIKKPKKMPKEFIILEEEGEIQPEELPEGGPRLEDLKIQDINLNSPEKKTIFEEEQVIEKVKPRKIRSDKIIKGVIPLGPELMIKIGDTSLAKRLPPLPVFNVNVSSYYMNNREIFVNFINGLLEKIVVKFHY
jgi:hypothetical protein